MGEYSEEIAASGGCGENNGIGSSKAHDGGISPQENRGGTKGTMGEDTGAGEESGLVAWGACFGTAQVGGWVWVRGEQGEICVDV